MIKGTEQRSFILDHKSVDEIAGFIVQFCTEKRVDRKDALRYRLSAEEALLSWIQHGFEGHEVIVSTGKRLFTPFISIEIEGEPFDPFRDLSGNYGSYLSNLLSSLNLAPEYTYYNDVNCIRFRLKVKHFNQITTLCLVLAAAFFVGILGNAVLSESVRNMILGAVVTPLYDTFFSVLSCIAGPMIFLSVAWGIYGIGDTGTLGRIGKHLMLSFIGIVFLNCALGVIYVPFIGPEFSSEVSISGSQTRSLAELILGIFPGNIIEPFLTGNTLQIIFLAAVIGIALLFLGKHTKGIAEAIDQINVLVQFLMRIISRLVPYVVFLVIINLIWSDMIMLLISTWQLPIVLLVSFIVSAVLFILITSARNKVDPMILVRKSLPTFIVSLTTASSAASFGINTDTCKNEYGINSALVGFGVPLGIVIHKPITALYNFIITVYLAKTFGIEVSAIWLAVAVFIAAVVAIATPPIPGGGSIAYAILFTQLGLPEEALAIAFTLDIIFDFFITSFDMVCIQMSLINVSSDLAMIDKTVLRTKK